jgi:hypothetical protein
MIGDGLEVAPELRPLQGPRRQSFERRHHVLEPTVSLA